MLYTVLGLYDPAELAIDIRLILFAPSHHGFAPHAESSATQPDTGFDAIDPNQLGMATVMTSVCVGNCRRRA